MATRTYFAAERPRLIGEKLMRRIEDTETNCTNSHSDHYAQAYSHYYGVDQGQGVTNAVTRKGEQGELAAFRVNRARSFAKALISIILGPKVSWRPQARNGDAGAAKGTSLASALLEDIWKTGDLSSVYALWVEQALIASFACVFPEWDLAAGPPLMPDKSGNLILQGDVTLHNVLPWNLRYDTGRKSWKELEWKFVRLYKNRFTLAKLHPRLIDGRAGSVAEDAILGARASSDDVLSGERNSDDVVPVWYFFHDPTPALPLGRRTILLSSDVVLADGPLTRHYPETPVYRLAADEMFDSPHGWSAFWDSLGAQEIQDGLDTMLATIITTLGNTRVAVEKGSELAPEQEFAGGPSTWTYPKGGKPPAAVQLAVFPERALDYGEKLTSDQKQTLGLNDVALGQPAGAQMNAQAFAVLASMAVQQASPFQSAATAALGRLGSGVLKILGKHVTKERILKVAGKAGGKLYSEKRWKGADLSPVDGVLVDVGNALEQTPQGRMALLELYQQAGLIKAPEQVQQVVETGRLDVAISPSRDEMHLIQAENEALQEGSVPPVHTYQNHALHYPRNAAVLLSPDALNDPGIINATQAHLDRHYTEFFGLPPEVDPLRLPRQRFLLGQGPEPMPMAPPGMEASPDGAPPGPVAPVAPDAPAEVPAAMPAAAQNVNAPPMPQNPMTGAAFANTAPPLGA